jgi:lipopolysaccharide/colanic/teichoic acid biosynthesis glycosyltransferase
MLKLRTMWNGPARWNGWIEYIDDYEGPEQKRAGDPRVSNWFARFCRRHSIDELPQLWHVITGKMSLVGPRPMTRPELQRYYGDDAEEILQVKPGSRAWQISRRNRLVCRAAADGSQSWFASMASACTSAFFCARFPKFSAANSW